MTEEPCKNIKIQLALAVTRSHFAPPSGVIEIAEATLSRDGLSYRKEFIAAVRQAQRLSGQK